MYWKKWKAFREPKLEAIKERAKGRADLKPRHIKRATQIIKDEFYDKLDKPVSLNVMFDVEYGEAISTSYENYDSPFLKLIKNNHSFTGKSFNVPIILGKDHGVPE